MFDRISVMIALPGYPADAPKDGFWTTDFGCDGTLFTIREDGRLLNELWHLEPIPEEEQEFWNELNCLLRASGATRKVVDGLVHKDFEGILRFSRHYKEKLYEFEAEFSSGMLRRVEPRLRDDVR